MSDEATPLPHYASEWDQQMYDYLTTHARTEGVLLEGYVSAAATTKSKAFSYLVGVLAADEHRHHRFFSEIASSLRSDVEMSRDDPLVPRLDFKRADPAEIRALTKEMIANEEHDAAELKRLRKDLHDLEHTTLWTLLVEIMQHDTAKHLAVLKFIDKHT